MLAKFGMLIAAINGKTVYDSIDNKEFLEALLKHPNFITVVDTVIDTLAETTTSETVMDNLNNYRGLAINALKAYNPESDFNLMSVINSVVASGTPEHSTTSSTAITQVSSSDAHNIL